MHYNRLTIVSHVVKDGEPARSIADASPKLGSRSYAGVGRDGADWLTRYQPLNYWRTYLTGAVSRSTGQHYANGGNIAVGGMSSRETRPAGASHTQLIAFTARAAVDIHAASVESSSG
jgi:hypothetical protein